MNEILKPKSIQSEILDIVFLSIFFITAALGYFTLNFSKSRLVAMLGESSKGIAITAANFITGDDLLMIQDNIAGIKEKYLAVTNPAFSNVYEKTGGEETAKSGTLNKASEKYWKYVNILSNVKNANKIESPINIYIQDRDRLKLLVSSDKALLIGAEYSARPEAEKAISTNVAQATRIYKDKDGMWISAFAPIQFTEPQKARAIIEINYKIDQYIDKLRRELVMIVLLCFMGLLGTAVLGYHLVNNLVSTIKKLDDVASELEKEHYNIPIEIESENEIGHLAKTFEALRTSIKKKIEELRLSLIEEKKAHLESIIALTNAIELRDPYTRQHLYRVNEYALLIAKVLHLGQRDIEKLRYSCYLHDIGKIYIEDSLLQKSNLSKEELEDIRQHSEKGAKIIDGIPFLHGVKDVILHHQERYDGTGYPSGLKGEEIPFLARIVSVADAFDAMTTDRPYRPKIGFSAAMDVIENGAGTQFDPKIAKAFLKYRDSIEKIAKKHFL